jgi:NAD(P)-dependent dehydrogenase (short-subunit alcohol dehydrogenase family)
MGKRLEGKIALVTGAASGIGRAVAIVFAREGAKVVVADIVDTKGAETVKIIKEEGGDAIFVHADVSRPSDAEAMVKAAVERYGRIDVLHNNAGIPLVKTVTETTEEEWDRIIDVNLKGVFLGSKYAIKQMQKQGGGAIINTASNFGLIGSPNWPAYCASKGGVVLLTKAMAIDHSPDNIRVNCICPGNINTPMLEFAVASSKDPKSARALMGRIAQPEEVAYLALYLASDESKYCTGASFVIDNGETARGGPTWPSPHY